MGMGLRIFIVEDDDSLRRMPVERFNRLCCSDRCERCPEYAGRRMRYALVSVNIQNRRARSVLRVECSYLKFDATGAMDWKDLEEGARLGTESMAPRVAANDNVIPAGHLFAAERIRAHWTWEPGPSLARALREAALGRR